MKFQNPNLYFFERDRWTRPKAKCPLNLFKVWGIINLNTTLLSRGLGIHCIREKSLFQNKCMHVQLASRARGLIFGLSQYPCDFTNS